MNVEDEKRNYGRKKSYEQVVAFFIVGTHEDCKSKH